MALSRAPSAAAPLTSSATRHASCGRPTGYSNPADGSPSWASSAPARHTDAGSSACCPRAASNSSIPTSYRASSTTRASSPTRFRPTVPSSSPARRVGTDVLQGLDYVGGRERALGAFLRYRSRPGPHSIGHRVFQRGVVGEPCGQSPDERVSSACGVNDFHTRGREMFRGFAARENGAAFSDRDHDGCWPQGEEFGGSRDGSFYAFDPLA